MRVQQPLVGGGNVGKAEDGEGRDEEEAGMKRADTGQGKGVDTEKGSM